MSTFNCFRRHIPRYGTCLMLLILSLMAGICPPVMAQQEAPSEAAKPTEQAAIELTAEAVQARIDQIKESKELDEATKQKLLELWNEALGQVRAADEWAAKAVELEKQRQEAPALLDTIKAELAQPTAELKPDIPPGATVVQLEQLLAQAEAELAALQKTQAELDDEPKRRADRRIEVPNLVAAAKQRLEEVTQQLGAPPAPDETAEMALARHTLLLARKKALEQEIRAYEEELRSYDARGDLLTARRDQAERRVSQAEKLAVAWKDVVNERRRLEAEQAAKAARDARKAAAEAHPALHQLAKENARLAELRTGPKGLAAKIEKVSKDLEDMSKTQVDLESDWKNVEERVSTVGLTQAISLLLRQRRADLPDIGTHRRHLKQRRSEISNAQLQLIELEDERSELGDIEDELAEILANVDPSISPTERGEIEKSARGLLQDKRDYLESLIKDYNSYFVKLVDLSTAERKLVNEVGEYATYIDEKILWFRSTSPCRPADLHTSFEAARWLAGPSQWAEAFRLLWADARARPLASLLRLAIFIGLLLSRRRLCRRLEAVAELVPRTRTDKFSHTIKAFIYTVLIALVWPLLMWFIGWRLASVPDGTEFAKAIGVGLQRATFFFFTMEFLRQLCRVKGLGDEHFGWPAKSLKLIRKHLRWLMAVGVPMVFIVWTMESQANNEWKDSFGRLAFMIGLVAFGIFTQRVLRPSGAVMKDIIRRNRGRWPERMRYIWYPLTVGIPIALAVLGALGYYYTAIQLARRMIQTLWLIVGLLVLYSLLARWLFVARRRLALKKAEERKAAEKAEKSAGTAHGVEDIDDLIEEPDVDLYDIGTQTRELLRSFLGVGLIIGLWLIWVDVFPALGILKTVTIWTVQSLDKMIHVTLAELALAVVVVIMTVVASKNIPGLLEIALLQRLPLDHGVRYAITSISRYLITVVGIIIAFSVIGIGWSKVQWLVAAVTVGLGFGLQEIFANFVSGLIILFERPMRVGDTITVGDVTGTVTKIRIRATTITDWDRKELIVPNKEFVTGQLVNWTLSDSILRLTIPVGIAYGSDTARAVKELIQVAKDHPDVLDDPSPYVIFKEFGDSSLNFELRLFIPSMEYYLKVWHDMNMNVDQAFRKAGIEIAFPQRDVHVRSIRDVLAIGEKRGEGGAGEDRTL